MGEIEKEEKKKKSERKEEVTLSLMERYKKNAWTGKEVQKIEKEQAS